MPRFSANLGFLWPELDLLGRIEAAARAGFRAVELHFPYGVPALTARAAFERLGLKLLGINTDVGQGSDGHRGLAAVPGREAEFAALIDQATAWAQAAGGTSVHAMAGLVPPPDRQRGFETIVANLKKAAPLAADRGLTLLVEPLNPRDNPGYFYSTVEEGAAVIDAVGAPNVKLMFDAYHVGVAQGDVITRLKAQAGRIGHVQIASVPWRREPDEGEIAFPAIFEVLEEIGYDGWIGCEYRPRAGTDEGLAWTERLGVDLRA